MICHVLKAQSTLTDSCSFFNHKIIYPYYYPSSPSNGKDFYVIKQEFIKSITAKTNFNGIITVIFFINYKGETNFYKTQLCDLNYKTISITKENNVLCDQILDAVKNTGPWKPMLDESNQAVTCRKFYSFKFNNGQLIEILPK
jgi:hypothetical protein